MPQTNISFETVIKGLECCQKCDGYTCRNCCPYHDRNEPEGRPTCTCHLAHDALALLKNISEKLEETQRAYESALMAQYETRGYYIV